MSTAKHIHEGNEFNNDMTTATIPPLLMGLFFYGPRVLLLAVAGVFAALITDRLCALLRGLNYDQTENSSIPIAMIIVLLMPASVSPWVVAAAVASGVLVGKHAFGGYMNYPFNPAAVGFCIAAVSWPDRIFRYPPVLDWLPSRLTSWESLWELFTYNNITVVEGASSSLRNRGLPTSSLLDLLLGEVPAPLGVSASLVILACGVYLLIKKRAPFAASASFLLTVALISFFFPRAPQGLLSVPFWQNALQRLNSAAYEMLSGATIFASVFLVNEPETLPKNTISRLIYGALLAVSTVLFRYFGTYEIGICFAFLLINAVSGYFDRTLAALLSARNKEVSGS